MAEKILTKPIPHDRFWTTLWRDDEARHLAVVSVLCAVSGTDLLWPPWSAVPIALGFVFGIVAGVGGMASVMIAQDRLRERSLLRVLNNLKDVLERGESR